MHRKLKIFDYTWNVADQYDMICALKDDCEFYHCLNIRRQWDPSIRPVPDQLKFVTGYKPGVYDLAILHIDQQAINPKHKQVLIYNEFNECIIDIPKIVINHGSPVFPEWFDELGSQFTEKEMDAACIYAIKSLVGESTMVVNSYTSCTVNEWGWGVPIIPGINSHEWLDLPKEPRAFTALAPYQLDCYYNRNCMMDVADILYERHGHILIYAGLNIEKWNSIEAYKRYLGKSLLYIDTSIRTPINRTRTEAFLSGCCVVQVEGAHDLEHWAKPGENMIIAPNNPEKIAAIIAEYLENKYEEAIVIGQNGKKMAIENFSLEHYHKGWLDLFYQLIPNCNI